MHKLLRFHQNPILTNLYQNLEDVEHPEIKSYLHEQVEVEEKTTKHFHTKGRNTCKVLGINPHPNQNTFDSEKVLIKTVAFLEVDIKVKQAISRLTSCVELNS